MNMSSDIVAAEASAAPPSVEPFGAPEPTSAGRTLDARPELGGRDIDEHGVNKGLLRCPRCSTRLASKVGELQERSEADALLWVPRKPAGGCSAPSTNVTKADVAEPDVAEADVAEADVAEAEEALEAAPAPAAEEAWEWTSQTHVWWWRIGSMDDVDNLGLSRLVTCPAAGSLKLAMCVECSYGPVGFQREDEPTIWLACELLHQQDASSAIASEDFRAPAGISVSMLQNMIESGMASVQFHVTFEEYVLGMQLTDAVDGLGVEVMAFTVMDEGQALPAERSGQVAIGDKVSRVNGQSTAGRDCGAVLTMVREATRPVTIHFERRGVRVADAPVERVPHQDWKSPPDEASLTLD